MPKKSIKSKAKATSTSGAWFYPVRGSYYPKSWLGWASYVPYVALLWGAHMWAQNNATSVSDYVFKVFPVWVAAAVVMSYFAKIKS